MADDRLFNLESIPEVPLFREPRRAKAARGVALDARFANDYPPEWHRCSRCAGRGTGVSLCGIYVPDEHPCQECLGMGSLKARVRLEAGHRCERCQHPYIPKGDAKMLGVGPSPFQWSPCDPRCTHDGPIRWCEAHEAQIDGIDFWRYQDTLHGRQAGDGILDYGPSGEQIERYAVEAEWRILTVHHANGDKACCSWWNLIALCQRCHLEIQAKVVLERVYPYEHSSWFKPHAAGWYALAYEGREITREEAEKRMEELLAYEHTA